MNYRAVIQSGNCLIENSSPVTVTVSPPSDGGTLSSAADVCSGANNGTLSLTGYTGNILRWEKSIDGGTIWTSIVNTTDNYTYSNLTLTTIYRVVVQSGACTSANSVPVQITVSAPTIAGIISGNDTVCNGSNSGTLTLMGHTGSVVRWQSSDDAGLTWSNITNTTGITTYNFANITTTTNFRAVVQNGACPVINSSHDTITVLPVSDGGSLAPVSYSACSGINSGTILLSGQSGNILRWESSVNGGITWSQIANTNPSQSFNNIVATTLYRAVVQEGQCTAAYSALSTISVFPATVSGSITGSDTVCTGTNSGSLSLNGYTGSILNWEYSKNGGVTWTNISNTTANHNYTNLTATTQYRAIVQSGSCASANSSIGTIMVNPITIGGNVLSSSSVCDSTTTGMLTLSGHVGSILHWESSIDSGNTWATIANTSNTQMYNGITTAIMYKALVESPGCTSVNSTFATISLSIPAIASYSFSTSGTTAIFTNTSTSNGGTSFWDFGDNTSSTVASPAHTYVTTGTYTVQLIISDSCGSDTTVQIVSITGLNISEIYNNPNVSIYPNPFSNAATIEMSFDPTASTLKIFDVYGKEVRNINLDPGTKALKLERENLLSGIYFYKIESPHEIIATGKIVIQ
jgi:PKD repeat protein